MKRTVLLGVIFLALSGIPATGAPGVRVLIQARNPASLAAFYRDGLGFAEIARDSSTGSFVFDAGNVELVLVPLARTGNPGGVRLLLPTGDLDQARARLLALGVSAREVTGAGGRPVALYFHDPEGHPLGYVPAGEPPASWLPPLAAGREAGTTDRSGRVGLMVFGGIYGTWLGVAVPVGAGADDATPIGLGVIMGGPLGVLAADRFAAGHEVGRGRAGAVSLGGTFATWQGLGWSGVADLRGRDAVLVGAGSGLAGIAAAVAVTAHAEVGEGQAGLLHSAADWGAWFGLAGARIGRASGDGTLASMLLASGAGLAAGTVWSLGHDIEPARVLLISLAGVLGTAAGIGLDLVVRTDNEAEGFAIPAATGALGLAVGAYRTSGRPRPGPADSGALLPGSGMTPAPGGGWRVELLRARF